MKPYETDDEMLRPRETVQKLLLSSPAHYVAEYEASDVMLTHAWSFDRRAYGLGPFQRGYFVLSFTTPEFVQSTGVVVPDYGPTGEFMCALLAMLFGKRFDHHGPVEMTGQFRVPDLSRSDDYCDPNYPFHGNRLRADYPVALDLREVARLRRLIDEETADAKRSAAFHTAALFYARALRTIERDPEVAYLHLITACERLAETAPLAKIELEAEVRTALARIGRELDDGDRVAGLFRKRMRQLKRRFTGLVADQLDDDFFARTESRERWGAFQKSGFPRAAAAAYDLRSRYVHTGVSFGSWIAPRYSNEERQVGRPVLPDSEMVRILAHAPTFIGLERITRVLLLKWAKSLGVELPLPAIETEPQEARS